MKKALLIMVCGLGLLTACKKDRICECTSILGVDKVEYKKVTKKYMIYTADCVSKTYFDTDGTSVTETCEIK